MKSILDILSDRVAQAVSKLGVEADPLVRNSGDEKFGDYQSNCAMGLAKKLGKKPRDVAGELVAHLLVDDICDAVDIAGPGFLNFRLRNDFVSRLLGEIPRQSGDQDDRLGLARTSNPVTVVVDMSSPNLAKEMHVGHLRSTVIGECVARVLEFDGHDVHRENHVGDWGTQFGMLVAYLRQTQPDIVAQPDKLVIRDLESFYVEAKARFDADDDFKTQARETVVALQGGDPATRRIWKAFCDESLRHCHEIFDLLGVKVVDRGESFYTELMGEVITRLEKMKDQGDGFVRDSQGALCLFMEGFKTRDGEPLPMIVRKSDGGHNYATSDLATIIHRIETLHAKRMVYVVGIAQKQHFEMLFSAARQTGWVGADVTMEHLGFGNMLGENGKPFKTREGGTVKLRDLLDQAVSRARQVVEKPPREDSHRERNFTDEQMTRIAETVGLAAVRYFDLSHSLSSDYRFNWDTMLAMEGNTAPYMLYAYARIRSIGRKAGVDFSTLTSDAPMLLEHPAELALAKKLLQFVDVVKVVARELRPNILTDYLFDLAKRFSRFYDRKLGVRVIDASPDEVRISRLRLCDLTARTLKLGLHLLGIQTLEEM